MTRRGIPWFRHGSQASRLGWLLVALLLPAWLLYPVLVDVVDRVKTRLVEEDYAEQRAQASRRPAVDILKRAEQQIDRVDGPARSWWRRPHRRRARGRRPSRPSPSWREHRAGGGAPDVGDRAVRRRRRPGQPLRAQLPRGGGRAARGHQAVVAAAGRPGRRGAAVRRRRAADAARRARPVRRRRQGRPAHRRRHRRLRDARLQRAVVHLVAEPGPRVLCGSRGCGGGRASSSSGGCRAAGAATTPRCWRATRSGGWRGRCSRAASRSCCHCATCR